MNNTNNFYEADSFPAMEQVELAEDIIFETPTDIEGKFYMKLMTPSANTDKIIERNENGIEKANYILLTIPAYLVLSFMMPYAKMMPHSYGAHYTLVYTRDQFTIPKGTKFLVSFVGGVLRLERLSIVGIYFEDEDE